MSKASETLAKLLATTSNDELFTALATIIKTELHVQDFNHTKAYARFMMGHASKMKDKIPALLRTLDSIARREKQNHAGQVMGVFRSKETSDETIGHLVLGDVNVFGLYFTIIEDKALKTKTVHRVVSAYDDNAYLPYIKHIDYQSQMVSTHDKIHELMSILDLIYKDKPLLEITKSTESNKTSSSGKPDDKTHEHTS